MRSARARGPSEIRSNSVEGFRRFWQAPSLRVPNGRSRLQVLAAVKKASGQNVVSSKTLVVKPEHMDKVKDMCNDLAQYAKEQMCDRSNGILTFEVMADTFEDDIIHFWERYADSQRLNKFNSSDKYQEFIGGVMEYLEKPMGLALYEYNDGQIGNLCIQEGPKGEGGLDDATGAGGLGGARMSQTTGVVNLGDIKRGEEGDSYGMGFKFPWQKDEEEESE